MNKTEYSLGGFPLYKTTNNVHGNPRYVVLWMAFHDSSYVEAADVAKQLGFIKYRGSDFGGGLVVSTYNLPYLVTKYDELVKSLGREKEKQ